jgi:hypothetical protein
VEPGSMAEGMKCHGCTSRATELSDAAALT